MLQVFKNEPLILQDNSSFSSMQGSITVQEGKEDDFDLDFEIEKEKVSACSKNLMFEGNGSLDG
jgi:hypothetical protein